MVKLNKNMPFSNLLNDKTKLRSDTNSGVALYTINILSLLNHYEYGTDILNYEFKAVNFSARKVLPTEQDKIRHQFFLVDYIAKHSAYRDIFSSKPDNVDWKQVTTLLSTKADELIGMINALKV